MIEGAINFSLKEAGTTTAIMGTFNETSNGLFSILKVDRDGANKITGAKIISRIYERNSTSKGQERYVYEYSDGTWSVDVQVADCTIRYDRAKMSSLTEINAVYYFEIPLNAGDYVLGATNNNDDKATAYLFYLDIGANGDKAEGDEEVDGPGKTAVHQIEGVTFVDSLGVAAGSTNGYSVVTFKVAISEGGYGKDHGGLTVNFNRSSKTNMTVTETEGDGKDVFTTTLIKDDEELTVTVGPPSS